MFNKQHKFTLSLPTSLERDYPKYRYSSYDTCFTTHSIKLGDYSKYQLYLRLGIFSFPTDFNFGGILDWKDEVLQDHIESYIPEILFEVELNSSAEILFEK